MRIFGTPSTKGIRNKADFMRAVRDNDQKALHGFGDDDNGSLHAFNSVVGVANMAHGIETHKFTDLSSYLNAATRLVWASSRALDIKAGVVVSTELKLIKRGEKASSTTAVRPDPELVRLLQNPNPHMTISELLYLFVWHYCGCGIVFWLKDNMNRLGQPEAIYPLNPRFMRIVPDKKTKIGKYVYRVNGAAIEFEPEEIVCFRRPHANDDLWGLGEIEQGESIYNEFINRALYNEKLMENGAFPSSLLVKEDFEGDQPEWDEIQKKFREKYQGVRNTGKVAMANGKWSLLQLGVTAAEMQELEKSKVNVEQIFLNHGVPLSVAGFGSANYATARQEDMGFRKYGILPILNMLCDVLNSDRGFIKAFHEDLMLTFSLAGIIDVEQVGKDYGWLFDRGGCTPNDLRELAGLPRVNDPMLDQYFVMSTYMPIEVAGIAIPSEEDMDAVPGGGDDTDAGAGGADTTAAKPGEDPEDDKKRQHVALNARRKRRALNQPRIAA